MWWGKSYLTPFLFLPFFISISPQNLWAHDPGSPKYSHIDVYYSTHTDTNLTTTDPVCPASGTYNAPLDGGLGPTVPWADLRTSSNATPTTIAVDFERPTLPSSKTVFIVRNEAWAGVTHCAISEFKFEIKRVRVQNNTLTRETVRTYNFPNYGSAASATCPSNLCIVWDGAFAVDDRGFGKVNGTYEASTEVKFSTSPDASFTATMAYPGAGQLPVQVDVMDIHSVISSPTVVGASRVQSFPIFINYKLSKTGYVTIDVYKDKADQNVDDCTYSLTGTHPNHTVATANCNPIVRRLVDNQTRWGEDTTQGAFGNVDTWDGRTTGGVLASSGTYVFKIFAWDPNSGSGSAIAAEGATHDQANEAERSISIDPLQIIDLTVQPLTTDSTGFAGINLTLTEAATAYFDIWKSSAVFGDPNFSPSIASVHPANCPGTSDLAACQGMLVRSYRNTFPARSPSSLVWDGRDGNGVPMEDASYVFSLWAQESEAGGSTSVITTSRYLTGTIPIVRGLVPISQVQIIPGVLPSTPPINGIAPYFFSYFLGRDAKVNLQVLASSGQYVSRSSTDPARGYVSSGVCGRSSGCQVVSLVNAETRSGRTTLTEPPTNGWDARDFTGARVSSGVYLVQLNATDTLFPNRVSSITAFFPVDTLRVAGGATSPILQGSSDVAKISYALSEPMDIEWTIYPPSTTFNGVWPDLQPIFGPVRRISGPRPGRTPITEFWDGTNGNGLFVNDGNYISVLKAHDASGNFATDSIIKEIPVSRGQILILNSQIAPTFATTENSSATINIPLEPFEIQYTLSRDAIVTLTINDRQGNLINTLVDREPRQGFIVNREFWDGTNFAGIRQTTIATTVNILAEDQFSISTTSSTVNIPLTVNLLRVYDVAVAPLLPDSSAAEISYQLSESMNIDLKFYKPGTQFNLAGQPFPAEDQSLVFRIFGPRPGRTGITESWEGINLFQKQLPDGNYVFRLTAQDERNSAANDIITGNVNILRLGFVDPQSTFDDQTFAYPNPATKSPVKICTLVPIDATVDLRIYTLGGDLLLERNLGFQRGGTSLCGTTAINWDLDNKFGRKVARGIYFYTLRADSVGGSVQFLQTRKKILVP